MSFVCSGSCKIGVTREKNLQKVQSNNLFQSILGSRAMHWIFLIHCQSVLKRLKLANLNQTIKASLSSDSSRIDKKKSLTHCRSFYKTKIKANLFVVRAPLQLRCEVSVVYITTSMHESPLKLHTINLFYVQTNFILICNNFTRNRRF